jgi:hypothetical protein
VARPAAPAAPAAELQVEEAAPVEPKLRINSRCSGVTLLELILALSLSILVMLTIGMAVNMYFRMLDVRRTNVEEARLANSILKHIADELRGAVQYTPPDLSGLEALTSSLSATVADGAAVAGGVQAAAGGSGAAGFSGQSGASGQVGTGGQSTGSGQSGAGQSGNSGNTGGTTGGAKGGSASTSSTGSGQSGASTALNKGASSAAASGSPSSPSSSLSSSTTTSSSSQQTDPNATAATAGSQTATTSTVVGFFGSATELRFDVSRLPRVDQYEATVSASGDTTDVQFPSDVKTVIYFLQNDENGQAILSAGLGGKVGFAEPSTSGRGRGLMRSEQDRAVLALAESSGNDLACYDGARLLAEEVVGLAFRYFDGTDWVTDWDSTSMGGLPRAVEIVLTVQPTFAMNEKALAKTMTDAAPEQDYRLVVRLPSAPLVTPPTPPETTTDAAAGTTSSTTSTGQATGGSATGSGATAGTGAKGGGS